MGATDPATLWRRAETARGWAVLHRPHATGGDRVEMLFGDVVELDHLDELDALAGGGEHGPGSREGHELLVAVPFRQAAERGFECVDDAAPLRALAVRDDNVIPLDDALATLPDDPLRVSQAGFEAGDDDYADAVAQVIEQEIGRGVGANFVLKRSFRARIDDFSPRAALATFRALLSKAVGSYWTFLVRLGDHMLVGATPERHVTLSGGAMTMNPISGTYRYPDGDPDPGDVLRFLSDDKETDELYMVVDEELKMMARLCSPGVRVRGPFLREMPWLAHTEYFLSGTTDRGVAEVLRETLFAPTVVGSPLESAFRVVSRHERRGRGYYSGVLALVGRDHARRRILDSAILIRTAEIDATGALDLGVGATLVRHSDPAAEARETWAKSAGMLAALGIGEAAPGARTSAGRVPGLSLDPRVTEALAARNSGLAGFWFSPSGRRHARRGARALVVDAEDHFTGMLDHQLRHCGLEVRTLDYAKVTDVTGFDLVVLGPGPGDPTDAHDPKIARLRALARDLLGRTPLLGVCLGHQALAAVLGFKLTRKPVPSQGAQRVIDYFGRPARVGFYNTYTAVSLLDTVEAVVPNGVVEVARDPASNEVHGLRARGLRSVQFHPESVLSRDGLSILRTATAALLDERVPAGREAMTEGRR
ncbi:phenazine-specific anthranilate synthase component I [Saccharomonospora saliphila]|uniref:phenazine-specific anthranilate synthase component I n=1 Tax=Saccharomonospora saliphila TaxID=369829 RepID=UPI000374E579|nr:phenazine-specific anthranilate synthase component I [Saccharomonospora saliphila]